MSRPISATTASHGAWLENTGYQAQVVDPERYPDNTLEHRMFRKMPVWKCPHHTSETGAQLCGQVWITRRMKEQADA